MNEDKWKVNANSVRNLGVNLEKISLSFRRVVHGFKLHYIVIKYKNHDIILEIHSQSHLKLFMSLKID